ncbi:MAG: acyltransferase family protein [Pirellulales bacterium]
MSQSVSTRPPLLPSLSGIRFWAAFQVTAYHAIIVFYVTARDGSAEAPRFAAWCGEGVELFDRYWFVRGIVQGSCIVMSFFFTLSGFVMSYTCLTADNRANFSLRNFVAGRTGRLYPVHLLGLLIYLPFFLLAVNTHHLSTAYTWGIVASTLTMTQSWNPDMTAAWNPPAWSLSCELLFYVLFPFLLPRFDGWSRRRLFITFVSLWLVSLVAPLAYLALDPDGIGFGNWLSDSTWINVVKHNPLVRLPEILGGMMVARLFVYRRMAERAGEQQPFNGGWFSVPCAAALVVILMFAEYFPYPLLHGGLLLPVMAGLIYGLAIGGGPIDWLFSRRWAVFLGDSCYALYILHSTIVALMTVLVIYVLDVEKRADPPGLLAYVIQCTIISILIGILAHKLYEEPLSKRVRRWLGHKSSPRAAAVPTPPSPLEEGVPAPAINLSSPAP